METKANWVDRFALAVSPSWGRNRLRARMQAAIIARHFEAAASGRRTDGWHRTSTDANAANGPALGRLRDQARDLVRNNAWAKNTIRVVSDHTVGWGISAKAPARPDLDEVWRSWAESLACDSAGLLDFAGLQALVLKTIVESGEVLVRRRRRRIEDGLPLPLQLQVLEPDFLDTAKDGLVGEAGGPIIQGVEFDKLGRRAAYWLFDRHPGGNLLGTFASRRIPASEILHVFEVERAGQVRGVSWFAPAVVNLRDFDEFEDASLMRQKIAACFAAFVTDVDGAGATLGEQSPTNDLVETLEPGLVSYLKPGQSVEFGTPPMVQNDGFTERQLRRIAAAMGVTYEDMTGDYSRANFSSARMARIKHWAHVEAWRWKMLVPRFCAGVWAWAMEAGALAGLVKDGGELVRARWTAPPMPMLEPDKEGLALTRLVRSGAMTPSEMVRERGGDPDTHWDEYQADMKELDKRGIWLDSDVRRTSQAGLTQERAAGQKEAPASADEAKADT